MLTLQSEFEVQFGDCDPAGIVFYPNYLGWFDASFWKMLRAASIGEFAKRLPIVEAHAAFRSPSRPGEVIAVTATVEEVKRSGVRTTYRITLGDRLVAEGWEQRICIGADPKNPQNIRAELIPDPVRAALTA